MHLLGFGERLAVSAVTNDVVARDGPVNALGCSAPLLLSLIGVFGVGWLGPPAGLAIAGGNHEQAFPTGGGTEVAGFDHAPFDGIALALKLGDKYRPSLAAALGGGAAPEPSLMAAALPRP